MDVHYTNAGNFIQAKDYNSALTELKETLKNHSNNADVWSTYGVCLFHLKQMNESIMALNKSQELEPENPYRYSSRAYIHSIMGNTDMAISDYNKCIELDPSDVIALNNLGLVYEKQGHAKKAKTYFHEADQKAGIDHITEKNPPQTGISP
ncbi:MAG: Flp pilus assembly protein TadD, partial [Sphingobacteriales bacterium]